ncbi:hypothetical protein [Campylobacter phage CJLB-10]|nr:hypothetical protein [Campylobacter phage CJLB-10]
MIYSKFLVESMKKIIIYLKTIKLNINNLKKDL